MTTIENIFKNFHSDDIILKLKELVLFMHPQVKVSNKSLTHANNCIDEFIISLKASKELREKIRSSLLQFFIKRRSVLLFATSGIYPAKGMVHEGLRRLAHKILPSADDETQAKSAILQIFQAKDIHWLQAINWERWASLFSALAFDEVENSHGLECLIEDLLEALRVVSHRVAANGLEDELLRLDRNLEKHESPFLAQCEEALTLARNIEISRRDNLALNFDELHLIVLLDQCTDTLERLRKKAQQSGASFWLSFHLNRLQQHIIRAERLATLAICLCRQAEKTNNEEKTTTSSKPTANMLQFWKRIAVLWHEPAKESFDVLETQKNNSSEINSENINNNTSTFWERTAKLWQELVISECKSTRFRDFWRTNSRLVAIRVTENSGKSGEKYISKSIKEYKGILAAALGGGVVIAFMAINKILILQLGLPPLIQTLIVCINYALGFVLIHFLHFSVATKQPAMTANSIVMAIAESQRLEKKLTKENKTDAQIPVILIIASAIRSQIAAIIGNLGLAVPISIIFAYVFYSQVGEHFLSPSKAQYYLFEYMSPFAISTIFYAGITGVCLFLAGIIDGYYDNYCLYNDIPQRLAQLKLLKKIFGKNNWIKITNYIKNNLGAIVGNICFGFLLGGVNGLGYLLGLPIDVRHITITSANWGLAIVGYDFVINWQSVIFPAIGILLIGAGNLGISFYLALTLGLKARGVTPAMQKLLWRTVIAYARKNPREFFLPK